MTNHTTPARDSLTEERYLALAHELYDISAIPKSPLSRQQGLNAILTDLRSGGESSILHIKSEIFLINMAREHLKGVLALRHPRLPALAPNKLRAKIDKALWRLQGRAGMNTTATLEAAKDLLTKERLKAIYKLSATRSQARQEKVRDVFFEREPEETHEAIKACLEALQSGCDYIIHNRYGSTLSINLAEPEEPTNTPPPTRTKRAKQKGTKQAATPKTPLSAEEKAAKEAAREERRAVREALKTEHRADQISGLQEILGDEKDHTRLLMNAFKYATGDKVVEVEFSYALREEAMEMAVAELLAAFRNAGSASEILRDHSVYDVHSKSQNMLDNVPSVPEFTMIDIIPEDAKSVVMDDLQNFEGMDREFDSLLQDIRAARVERADAEAQFSAADTRNTSMSARLLEFSNAVNHYQAQTRLENEHAKAQWAKHTPNAGSAAAPS